MNGWPGDVGSTGASRAAGNVHLEVLPGRVERCIDDAYRILASLRAIELREWQSPAGRAYRNTVGGQCEALWQSAQALQAARTAVSRHAEAVAARQEPSERAQWWN